MWIVGSALLAIGGGALFIPILFPGKSELFPLLRRSLCLGFLVQLALLLLAQSLPMQMVLTGFAALLGGYFFFWKWERKSRFNLKIVGFIFVALLFLFRILIEPVQQWDARSVWFFQGKILFYEKKMGAIWDTQNFLFGNFDYPKLHAMLAAQVAQLQGYWNEYLPKFSLFLLLLPILCFFFETAKKNGYFWATVLLALFVPGSLLWEGYMDGYFSLYAFLSLYFFTQFVKYKEKLFLIEGVLAAGVALSLKNEGALFFAASAVALLPFLLKDFSFVKKHWRDRQILALLLLVILPFLLWWFHKLYFSIPSQMFLHPVSKAEIFSRISFQSFWEILKSAGLHGKGLQGLAILALAFLFAGRKKIFENLTSLGFLGLWMIVYFFGISYALYSNSMELYLPQHLHHIMDRLMLTVLQAFFVGIFLLSFSASRKRA